MTDQVNPFDNTNPTEPKPGETTPTPQDTFVDQLKAIQNENGEPKYKDIPTALSALGHSQQHITTLETEKTQRDQELSTLREQLASKKSVEDFVKELTEKQDPPSSAPTDVKGLDEQAINALVARQLSQAQTNATQETNLASVITQLNELYGDKAREVMTSKAAEFGTTPEALEAMSKDNPSMVMAILGGAKVSSPNKPTTSSVQSSNQPPKHQPLEKPEKSIMRGATGAEVADVWRQVQADVHQRFGVE